MGNSLGCSGLGERLAAAARDGDVLEARRLLSLSPGLARYTTFGTLNAPLHFAAAKGHNEVATLLLKNGADVNSKNIYGQTPLMQACRFGHWEVVQTLLVFRCNVMKVDNLSSRTALHFAAAGGHVKCIRLLAADFVQSSPYGSISCKDVDTDKNSFVNKAASGGVTALHVAALHGHLDCVHLLLDLHASASAQTLPSSMGSIGAGSTPLHYAACGGNLKCCQVLISRGANRLAMNCNGWLPLDVARIWGCHGLDHVLSPKSLLAISKFPPSNYLSSPLMSILNIAREYGLQSSTEPSDDIDDADACAVCLERSCDVAAEGCRHELCVKCALDLCSAIKAYDISGMAGSIPCPLCRSGIVSFRKLPTSLPKDLDLNLASGHCKNCNLQPCDLRKSMTICRSAHCQNYIDSVASEVILPLSCAPFPSSAILS